MQHQHEAAHPPPNGTDRSTVKVVHRVLCHMGFNDANDIADQKNDQQSASLWARIEAKVVICVKSSVEIPVYSIPVCP